MVIPSFRRESTLAVKKRGQNRYRADILYISLLAIAYYLGKQYGTVSSLAQKKDYSCTSIDPGYEEAFNARVDALTEIRRSHLTNGSNEQLPAAIQQINKKSFHKLFDYGNPIDDGDGTNIEHALIIYNKQAALKAKPSLSTSTLNDIPFASDPAEATQSCDELNTFLLKPKSKSCTIIVGEPTIETNHVLQWIRTKPGTKNGPLPDLPLVKASRGTAGNGSNRFSPIGDTYINQSQSLLQQYFQHLDTILEELTPIAKRVASKNNEIIVVTSNFGQSALLQNFVCHARGNGFDLSNVLVFPTDQETYDLAKGMGLEAFYDEKNFGSLPSREANFYGDRTFVAMMYAKVISVQIINHLGYNVLFQDIDVVWYKHPLSSGVFTDPSSPLADFDMLFQDDGAHSLRYAPYSANTGFYYVRHNIRTKYFFTQFLYNGALVMRTHSHQAALIALMSEHSSYLGLKVKVLDGYEFPGGFHYHRRKEFMKDVVKKNVTPYIFHMSWTKNKANKLLFMKQMGMWYMEDKCVDRTVDQVMKEDKYDVGDFSLINACCSTEPLLSCHYRDKPSVIDCSDKDPIDKGKQSFWKMMK